MAARQAASSREPRIGAVVLYFRGQRGRAFLGVPWRAVQRRRLGRPLPCRLSVTRPLRVASRDPPSDPLPYWTRSGLHLYHTYSTGRRRWRGRLYHCTRPEDEAAQGSLSTRRRPPKWRAVSRVEPRISSILGWELRLLWLDAGYPSGFSVAATLILVPLHLLRPASHVLHKSRPRR